MAHIITEITSFDNKRNKVTLDYGEVTFLLYKGECRRLGINVQDIDKDNTDSKQSLELSEEAYRSIMDEILLPRAKKRVLYYLKSADKTREQIRRKLKEGYYPDEIIEETFRFLDRYGFADDDRYAEQYTEELRGNKSRKEIALKLKERGISREKAADIIAGLCDEDEYNACAKALKKKYMHGIGGSREDRQKAYAYLARRGFSYDAIEHAMLNLSEVEAPDGT